MYRRQVVVAIVLAVCIFLFFAGMWSPTPFGVGDAPSASDGTDEYGFPLRYKSVPSGECGEPGCADPTTSTGQLAVNGITFVAATGAAVALSRRFA